MHCKLKPFVKEWWGEYKTLNTYKSVIWYILFQNLNYAVDICIRVYCYIYSCDHAYNQTPISATLKKEVKSNGFIFYFIFALYGFTIIYVILIIEYETESMIFILFP